jgi:hypothetical protein
MIDGMRMDLVKSRYDNYDELYEYCYRVAGTVALMSMPVMGVDKNYKVRHMYCTVCAADYPTGRLFVLSVLRMWHHYDMIGVCAVSQGGSSQLLHVMGHEANVERWIVEDCAGQSVRIALW